MCLLLSFVLLLVVRPRACILVQVTIIIGFRTWEYFIPYFWLISKRLNAALARQGLTITDQKEFGIDFLRPRGHIITTQPVTVQSQKQYLLTCKVSRYCLLTLHGCIRDHWIVMKNMFAMSVAKYVFPVDISR